MLTEAGSTRVKAQHGSRHKTVAMAAGEPAGAIGRFRRPSAHALVPHVPPVMVLGCYHCCTWQQYASVRFICRTHGTCLTCLHRKSALIIVGMMVMI